MPVWARIGVGVGAVALVYGAVTLLGGDGDETDVATPDTTITETTTAAPDECAFIGSWTLDGPAFAAEVSAWMESTTEYVSGTYTMEFLPDGGFVSQRSAWTLRHEFSDGAIVTETTTDEEGTWSTDGTTLTVTAPGDPAAAVMAWIEIDGELVPLPAGQVPMTAPGISGSATYTCPAADTLVLAISYPEGPLDATLRRSG